MKMRKFTLELFFYDDDKESMKMTTTEIFDDLFNHHSPFYKRTLDIIIKEINY